jgi:cytidine deaminase
MNITFWDVTPCGSCKQFLVTANVSRSLTFEPDDGGDVPTKRRSLQEPHGLTSKQTAFSHR